MFAQCPKLWREDPFQVLMSLYLELQRPSFCSAGAWVFVPWCRCAAHAYLLGTEEKEEAEKFRIAQVVVAGWGGAESGTNTPACLVPAA